MRCSGCYCGDGCCFEVELWGVSLFLGLVCGFRCWGIGMEWRLWCRRSVRVV